MYFYFGGSYFVLEPNKNFLISRNQIRRWLIIFSSSLHNPLKRVISFYVNPFLFGLKRGDMPVCPIFWFGQSPNIWSFVFVFKINKIIKKNPLILIFNNFLKQWIELLNTKHTILNVSVKCEIIPLCKCVPHYSKK